MSEHTIQQTTIFVESGIPWWMKHLPWSWKRRLLKGRPLKGEMMMRCNEDGWKRVEFDAGAFGTPEPQRVSCPLCGEMLPMRFNTL